MVVLSDGVDSSVNTVLYFRTVGKRLKAIFLETGIDYHQSRRG